MPNRFTVGQHVTRMLAGTIPIPMIVDGVEANVVYCGAWTFDDATGMEIDHDLGFGPEYGITGSFITEQPVEEGA